MRSWALVHSQGFFGRYGDFASCLTGIKSTHVQSLGCVLYEVESLRCELTRKFPCDVRCLVHQVVAMHDDFVDALDPVPPESLRCELTRAFLCDARCILHPVVALHDDFVDVVRLCSSRVAPL